MITHLILETGAVIVYITLCVVMYHVFLDRWDWPDDVAFMGCIVWPVTLAIAITFHLTVNIFAGGLLNLLRGRKKSAWRAKGY